MEEETMKLCVRAVIPPRDVGLQKLMHEYNVYKKVLIPRVRDAVRQVVKDKTVAVYAQQKWMIDKKLNEYLKNLPFHPMPFHNQSVYIENSGRFWIHFKTKQGEVVCNLRVPAKYHVLIEKASSNSFGENPILGQVELIEDRKYGWVNCHITLRLPKPKPYEPEGWLGVDVGYCKLATSILACPSVASPSVKSSVNDLEGVAASPNLEALSLLAFSHEHKAHGSNSEELEVHDCNYMEGNLKFSHPTVHGKDFKTRIIQLRHLLKEYARKGKAWKKWNYRLKYTIKNAVGVVAKEIVPKAKKLKAGVAMEKLTFKATTKGYLVPRYKMMVAVKTLCEREGVPFKLVPAQYTSITCPKCNYRSDDNRIGKRFKCRKCGYEADADIVGAMNIAKTATQMEG